jgi:hypothetical protein
LSCNNPCKAKKQIRKHFNVQKYINEFYDVSPEIAKKLLKREVMKAPIFKYALTNEN